MTGKRIAAFLLGALLLLSIYGNLASESTGPETRVALLTSLAGAALGLFAGLITRLKMDIGSFWWPLGAAILGAMIANWLSVIAGFQYPNANTFQALARVSGRGFAEGFLYGGGLFLVVFAIKGPYHPRESSTSEIRD